MASKKKSSSTKKTTTSSKPKVKTSFTNTSGQKVTVYSDGSKSYSGGSSSSKSSPAKAPAPQTRDEQIKAALETAKRIQSGIKENASTFTEADREKLGAGLKGAQTQLDKYVAKEPKAVQDRVALAKAQAPGNAALVNPAIAPVTTPQITPDVMGVENTNALTAGMNAKIEAEKKAALERQKERDAANKESAKSWLGDLLSPSEARKKAQKETGFDVKDYFKDQEAGVKEIESLTNDYNAVVAARDTQIAQSNDKMASMNFINNQTAQIERNAAPKLNEISANINAKAATLQAQQGNFAEARSYVNDAVAAATADAKFNFDMFSTFYELNKDNFDKVDSIYTNAYQQSMQVAQMDYEEQLAEKQLIGEYMLRYPDAGLKISDSLEEASRKIGQASGSTQSNFSPREISRASQVLNGQAALSDFTTAEQANIRDVIWSGVFSTPDQSFGAFGDATKFPEQTPGLMSYDPSQLQGEWDQYRTSVAGPGAGQINSTFNLDSLSFDNL